MQVYFFFFLEIPGSSYSKYSRLPDMLAIDFTKYQHIVGTLWCQLEDMFQLIVTPQGIEKVMIQLIDTPTKVYAIGARLFLSKVPLEVLQN